MRILSLDLGTKKCGVAISDPLKIISQPLKIIHYNKKDFEFLFRELKEIIDEYNPIEEIILGFPKNINNDISPTGKMILAFKIFLDKKNINIPIILFDESYSSKAADLIMQELNFSDKKKKESRDMIAAKIILDNYLLMNKK